MMKNERINTITISLLILIAFLVLLLIYTIDIMNDKTQYILNLEQENKQCRMQLDSIMQDYGRLYNDNNS